MRISTVFAAALAVGGAAASSWFPGTKAVYNKWHETELERWLSDNNIVAPYKSWDSADLSAYLQKKGSQAASDAESTKDSLVDP